VEATLSGVTLHPDGRSLSARLIVPRHGKANVLQLRGHIVTDGLALVLSTDEHLDLHRLSVVRPLAVDQRCTQGLHLGGDGRLGLFLVIGVLGFQCTGRRGQRGIVHGRIVQHGPARLTHAAQDLLRDIVAVDQPVHGLTDLGDGKGVELAVLELGPGRVERQLIVRAKGQE